MSEHDEQTALFSWAAMMQNRHPALGLLFAIPNAGKRSIGAARYYLAEGLKSGMPDVFLTYPNGGYHGLFIEMKALGGKISEHQKAWIEALTEAGYIVYVCYSFEDAKYIICAYLGIEDEA